MRTVRGGEMTDEDKHWIEERFKRIERELGTDKPVPQYPPKVILQYREMDRQKRFDRQIENRMPVDATIDEVTLSCGHKQELSARMLDTSEILQHRKVRCFICANEWLDQAGKGEKPSDNKWRLVGSWPDVGVVFGVPRHHIPPDPPMEPKSQGQAAAAGQGR
jgi:hypothetical protein